MTTDHPRYPALDRLIGEAAIDPELLADLLRAPRQTAASRGLPPPDVELLADIRAGDLGSFARAVLARQQGSPAAAAPARAAG